MITKTGQLSLQEAVKSGRDIVVVSIGALIPQLLEVLQVTDFGEYQFIATVLLAAAAPFINRFLNLIRV